MKMPREVVKENIVHHGVISLRCIMVAAALTSLSLLVALYADSQLPEPLNHSASPDKFIAEIAHEHLVNLTSIGPRVAGSYENEVLAVNVVVEALRGVAAAASVHNRLEVDVMRASGAFSLTFLDGMSTVYRDVQGVVARARAAGGGARTALLLNCHYDSVPDSPGASDDAAGCAVALETLRALVATPHPLRHDVLVLLNGAEENILQASHAFITQHRWARAARAFVNVEACGAGGREVLFQAGPHEPWLLEAYAASAPHPFASSLAQELFESGLIPADTDFRIFRDYGNLSGVDLAWSSNGYVYHTRLDTADRVSPAVLQRTGDNVLALAREVLSSERLDSAPELSKQPVYFDVLGVWVVVGRAPAAALVAAGALLAVAAGLLLSARQARKHLYVDWRVWARTQVLVTVAAVLAHLAGLAAAVVPALVLHALGARLAFYARPWLLLPLYSLPALCGAWADARLTSGKWAKLGRGATRDWWAARAWRDALATLAAAGLAGGLACRLRSSFMPLLWTLPAVGALAAHGVGAREPVPTLCAAAASVLPATHTAYLALGSLNMFVPMMGRAGTAPLPPDVVMALAVGALTLLTFSWMLPLVVVARKPAPLMYAMAAVCAATVVLVVATPLGAPYSAERPQRLMVFHVRRTLHVEGGGAIVLADDDSGATSENLYWIPELDANTPHSLDNYVEGLRGARVTGAAECERWLYCGAPYFLPVLSLVSRGHTLPAARAPLPRLQFVARLLPGGDPLQRELDLTLRGTSHLVVVLAPAPAARIASCSPLDGVPQEGPAWSGRRTYFLTLHDAQSPTPWHIRCQLTAERAVEGPWVHASLAAHAMSGELSVHDDHARLLATLPPWVAHTGWGADLHLLSL